MRVTKNAYPAKTLTSHDNKSVRFEEGAIGEAGNPFDCGSCPELSTPIFR